MTRLIDADKLKIEMMKAFDCENATKYGNKNAEQQAHSYSTLMLYEISNVVEDCIDNAPTADDWQKFSDELWKNAYERGKQDARPQGEWYHSCEKGWECSQCHEVVKNMPTVMRKAKYHFCPNCGADMRKGVMKNE